jgi:hypothetical protein
MSRGPGIVERRIVEYLREAPATRWNVYRLTCDVFDCDEDDPLQPTRAQHESVRRVLRRLAARGIIRLVGTQSREQYWRMAYVPGPLFEILRTWPT